MAVHSESAKVVVPSDDLGLDKKLLERVVYLKACPVFSALPNEELLTLARVVVERKLKRDMTLFHESDPWTGLYLIKDGMIKLFKMAMDGREQILTMLGDRELLGLASAFEKGRYVATASAITDTELYIIPRENFEKIVMGYPKVAFEIIGVLGQRVRRAFDLVGSLAFNKVHQRVAALLLLLTERHPLSGDKGRHPGLQLSRRELAEAIGACPETVSRALSRFKSHGLIATNKRQIMVLKPERLRELIKV